MGDFKDYTNTELLKLINDAHADHDIKKTDIFNSLDNFKELENKLNSEIKLLDQIEKRYVTLMQELNSRSK
jgi:hypothetical protein